jgi:NAD(P)-dependent dehydrogenase (short-subunit alcohol dehydrogenase family)
MREWRRATAIFSDQIEDLDVNKKVCVITGSSSGIGAAGAVMFSQRGWDVCVNYSRDPKPAEAVAATCRSHGAEVMVERADVSDDAQCVQLAAHVKQRFGRCDVLVNNAGTTKFVDLKDLNGLDANDFQRIYSVNVIGPFQMTRAFAPLLRDAQGAGVVNVSSIVAQLGAGSSIAYVASKGALNALTLSLARVLGPQVRVNAVAPGMVDSPWLKQGLGPERFEALLRSYQSTSALGALVSPEEVAEAIYYLAVMATKTTGEVLLVDGGRRLGRL